MSHAFGKTVLLAGTTLALGVGLLRNSGERLGSADPDAVAINGFTLPAANRNGVGALPVHSNFVFNDTDFSGSNYNSVDCARDPTEGAAISFAGQKLGRISTALTLGSIKKEGGYTAGFTVARLAQGTYLVAPSDAKPGSDTLIDATDSPPAKRAIGSIAMNNSNSVLTLYLDTRPAGSLTETPAIEVDCSPSA